MKEIMKSKFILLVIVAFGLTLQFCTQPSELDDPVKVTPTDKMKARIYPQIFFISIGENGVETQDYSNLGKERNFETNKVDISVDTLSQTPFIWFKLNLERKNEPNNDKEFHRVRIKNINFNIDSFPVLGIPLKLASNEFKKNWIKLTIARGPKKDFDTIIDPSIEPNHFEIGFTLNKPFREIWANGYGKIFTTRFALIKRDTIVVDSVLKTRWDTVWIDNKPYIKKVEYWEVEKIKLQIQEITPSPDSLLMNFKFRLKY